MGTRSLVAWAATTVVVVGFARVAFADPKGDIQAKGKEAMESYDLIDYDAAEKLLNQAIATAKKAKLDKDPVTAKLYLELGIVEFANSKPDAAKAAFAAALKIEPDIKIDAAYSQPELTKLLKEAKGSGGGDGGAVTTGGGGGSEGTPEVDDTVDCKTVKGVQHTLIDTAKGGAPQPIEALVGKEVKAVKVSVMYRAEHAIDFIESKLTKEGTCKYTGAIPASGMKGSLIHYYVAAYDANGKVIAGKGSSGSPNIMELTAPAPHANVASDDRDDPMGGKKAPAGGGGGDVSNSGNVDTGVVQPSKPPKVEISVTGGTGFSYVTGKTEGENTVQNCCIGNSLLVVTPELAFHVSPQLSIGIAGRLGVPLGANVMGHATLAPAALLRLRYAFSPTGEGLRFLAQLGGGILRNTIKLDNPAAMGQDTDIVAQGPLLVGAGLGYSKRLGGAVIFLVDVAAIAGIAVVDHMGSAIHLNNGVGADLDLGLGVGF